MVIDGALIDIDACICNRVRIEADLAVAMIPPDVVSTDLAAVAHALIHQALVNVDAATVLEFKSGAALVQLTALLIAAARRNTRHAGSTPHGLALEAALHILTYLIGFTIIQTLLAFIDIFTQIRLGTQSISFRAVTAFDIQAAVTSVGIEAVLADLAFRQVLRTFINVNAFTAFQFVARRTQNPITITIIDLFQ